MTLFLTDTAEWRSLTLNFPAPPSAFKRGASLRYIRSPKYYTKFAKENLKFCRTLQTSCQPVASQVLLKLVLDQGKIFAPLLPQNVHDLLYYGRSFVALGAGQYCVKNTSIILRPNDSKV